MPCMVLASMTRDQHDPTFRFTTSRFFEQQHNLILYIIFDRHWQTLRSISGVNKSIASWLGSMVSIHHIIFRWRRSCFTLRGILPLSLAESSFTFVPLVNRCSFFSTICEVLIWFLLSWVLLFQFMFQHEDWFRWLGSFIFWFPWVVCLRVW